MFDAVLSAVRAEISGERTLESVRAIARHHRIQSTPGYDAAAAWLAETLTGFGLVPVIERARGDGRTRYGGALLPQGWACDRALATLIVPGGREALCDWEREPLSIVQRSSAMSGRYPLVSVGEGTEPAHYDGVEVRGRIVLSSGPVHRVLSLAGARGAAGILTDFRRQLPPVRTEADDLDAIAYTSFWWGERTERGWGFVVSPRVGRALRERLRDGEALEVEGEIAARRFDTDVPLVTATLGAPDRAREILVMGHLCHPRPGANDNASGAAAVLECARVLAALERQGAWRPDERRVRFLWMPEWNGTLAWLAADPARAACLDAALNLDMVGEDQAQCGSTMLIEHPPHWCASFAEPLLAEIRRAWIAGDRSGAPPRIDEAAYSGGSDHAILLDPARGVPCPMVIQWPDRYYHSSYDTPERCDPRSLAMAAGMAATYAGALAAAGPEEIRKLAEVIDRDHASRRQAIGAWSPDPGSIAYDPLDRDLGREQRRFLQSKLSLDRLVAGKAAPGASSGGADRPGSTPASRVPRRVLGAPLDLLWHLLPGWDDLTDAEHEQWRSLESGIPGGRLTLELAWYACDGARTVDEIAGMIVVETGKHPRPAGEFSLETFFQFAGRLGIAEWSSGRDRLAAGER